MESEGRSTAVVIEINPGPRRSDNNTNANSDHPDPATEINLDGHCFICLKRNNPLQKVEGSSSDVNNVKGVQSFQHLLCYLAGYPHNFYLRGSDDFVGVRGDEDSAIFQLLRTIKELPPLCVQCFNCFVELDRLHEELLNIQRRIQNETVKLRNTVSRTVEVQDGGVIGSRRDKYQETLRNSISIPVEQVRFSLEIVEKIHNRIISEGTSPVVFPSFCHCEESTEQVSSEDALTLLDVEIDSGDGSLPLKKHKVQVEFISVDGYPEEDEHRRIDYVVPMNEEEVVVEEQGMEVPVIEDDKCAGTTASHQQLQIPVVEDELGGVCDSAVNIGGVPVDPTANYVMITTNVTDPNTGIVSVQPILVSVAQLQATQQQQQSTSILPCDPGHQVSLLSAIQSQPNAKSSKKGPLGAYMTPSEYVYYNEELQPCDVCNARIPRGSEVASHLATHVGSDYVFYCPDCELGFISPFRLEKYHRSKALRCRLDTSPITDAAVFSCDQCHFQACQMSLFKKHLDEHENSEEGRIKSFQCPLCPLRFLTRQSVQLHLGERHVFTKPSGRQKCDVCGSFFDLGEIESHLWSHGICELLRCKLCMCMFSSVDAMIEHQKMVKRRGLHDISCHVCESRFLRVKDLCLHYFEEHSLGTKYLCEKCQCGFFTVSSFQSHQRKCSKQEEDDYGSTLKVTSVFSTSSTNPKAHKSSTASSTSTKKECPECGKFLSTSDILLRHRIKEHEHPPIQCSRPDCHEVFSSEADRKSHVAGVHQGFTLIRKPYTCPQCGESFAGKNKLKTHQFVKHSVAKPFSCEVCGLAYRNKVTLQDHVNIKHLGVTKEKDKVCDICERAFSNSQVLKHHKLTHTKERPFECATCGQRFRQRTAMKTHERAHAQLGEGFKPKGEMERSSKNKE